MADGLDAWNVHAQKEVDGVEHARDEFQRCAKMGKGVGEEGEEQAKGKLDEVPMVPHDETRSEQTATKSLPQHWQIEVVDREGEANHDEILSEPRGT